MSLRYLLFICTSLFLSACVQTPVFSGDDYAFIRSNYPIMNVNGKKIEPAYRLDLKAGENTVLIVYHTYRHDYYCTFSWNAEANTVYEVTDQENIYPLTLYRWVRTNSLWASRLDPMEPLECIKKPGRGNTADDSST